jgi:hypothetical protein
MSGFRVSVPISNGTIIKSALKKEKQRGKGTAAGHTRG